jgi:hypothetical protein
LATGNPKWAWQLSDKDCGELLKKLICGCLKFAGFDDFEKKLH